MSAISSHRTVVIWELRWSGLDMSYSTGYCFTYSINCYFCLNQFTGFPSFPLLLCFYFHNFAPPTTLTPTSSRPFWWHNWANNMQNSKNTKMSNCYLTYVDPQMTFKYEFPTPNYLLIMLCLLIITITKPHGKFRALFRTCKQCFPHFISCGLCLWSVWHNLHFIGLGQKTHIGFCLGQCERSITLKIIDYPRHKNWLYSIKHSSKLYILLKFISAIP